MLAAGAVASFDPTDVDGAAVALACADRLDEAAGAGEVLRVSRHPFGLPSPEPLPAGVLEAATEVRAHSDVFTPHEAPGGADPALRVGGDALTNAEVMAAATELAAHLGLTAGRLLTTCGTHGTDARAAVLALLAVPLAVGGSVVVAAPGADLDELTRTEGVTAPALIPPRCPFCHRPLLELLPSCPPVCSTEPSPSPKPSPGRC